MIKFAERLKNTEEYYFSKKLQEISELISSGKPIINMAIGSPDLLPPKNVFDELTKNIHNLNANKYQSYKGIIPFRKAIAKFYYKYYNVNLDYNDEIIPLKGSKEAILQISLAILNKDDLALIPNPGYPTYESCTKLVEAKTLFYNLKEDYHPNFEALEKTDLSKVKLMWVNYPHMPTGARATKSLFEKIIQFGKKHNILIINDNPYSFILNEKPLSILEIEGAKDIALELNSFSKTFNMAGWRIGMLCGKKDFLNEILKVRTQQDSGMFYAIQKSAIKALETPENWFKEQNTQYKERRELIWELCDKLNFTYQNNTSGLFVWAKINSNKTSKQICDDLLYNKNIFVTPGTVFGSQGEKHIRFSLCVNKEQIKAAIQRI